jgi:homoserine kinase
VFVRSPASSANLGPGFDVLGMALTMYADVGELRGPPPAGAHPADDHHLAVHAFRAGGGEGPVWVRTNIPMGRGLGYSGAVRAAGLALATVQQHGADALSEWRDRLVRAATELEGHPDNVAASIYGGVVVSAAGHTVRVPVTAEVRVVAWVPSFTTSTDGSRATLAADVPRADAVFNIGRTALLVAALAAGRTDLLADATDDRLHQPTRLQASPASARALEHFRERGAMAVWLSGSGPTVVALCSPDRVDGIIDDPPADGHCTVLDIDQGGTRVQARD